jgi:hypothetical protein
MKFIPVAVILTFFQTITFAQDNIKQVSEGFVLSLANAPAKTDGAYFLNPQFQEGDILLNSGETIQKAMFRLNLQRNHLEIQTANGVKLLHGNRVKSFTVADGSAARRSFVDGTNFINEGEKLNGFFEVVADGGFRLLSFNSIEVKAAAYSTQLDAGTKEARILKKEQFFFERDGKLVPAEVSRKKLKSDFDGTFRADIGATLEELDTNPKKKSDLVKLTQTLNQKSGSSQGVSGSQE